MAGAGACITSISSILIAMMTSALLFTCEGSLKEVLLSQRVSIAAPPMDVLSATLHTELRASFSGRLCTGVGGGRGVPSGTATPRRSPSPGLQISCPPQMLPAPPRTDALPASVPVEPSPGCRTSLQTGRQAGSPQAQQATMAVGAGHTPSEHTLAGQAGRQDARQAGGRS
jgi:hypothetical protein